MKSPTARTEYPSGWIVDSEAEKKDPSRHGYGLKSVERIVADHDGVINYGADERSFTVTVTFFDVE